MATGHHKVHFHNRRRRKSKAPTAVGDVLESALRKSGLTDQARRLRIYRLWRTAVGPRVASRTEPVSFRRGVLTVKAANAAWQNELTFLKPTIITKINDVVGNPIVKDLRVVGGRVAAWLPVPPQTPRTVRPSELDHNIARATSSTIDDPELRHLFEHAMATARCAERES